MDTGEDTEEMDASNHRAYRGAMDIRVWNF